MISGDSRNPILFGSKSQMWEDLGQNLHLESVPKTNQSWASPGDTLVAAFLALLINPLGPPSPAPPPIPQKYGPCLTHLPAPLGVQALDGQKMTMTVTAGKGHYFQPLQRPHSYSSALATPAVLVACPSWDTHCPKDDWASTTGL
jgi:hypothetical protein